MKSLKLIPVLMALALAGCGEKTQAPAASSPEAAAPVASASAPAAPAPAEATPAPTPAAAPAAPAASAGASAASPADLAQGEKIYGTTCAACHGAGVLGAPKFGDKAAWGPRVAKGKDTLYSSGLNGFNMMPPKGGNAALSDADVKAAVDYMISKAS